MDKDNVVRSSEFYMAKGDVLHILLRDWTCDFTIGLVDGDGTTEGTVVVGEDDVEVGFTPITFGMLYNWHAIDDDREIAPEGWHVPTDTEFSELITYLGGAATAGGKVKETGSVYWNIPNTGATNEVSFNGRGAGYRDNSDGEFYGTRTSLTLWAATAMGSTSGTFRELGNNTAQFYGEGIGYLNARGSSLRLIKDDSTNPGYMTGNDGKVYPTVKIGNQIWMAQNSAETKYRDTAFNVEYGALYNHYAVSDVREITSVGWHIPTKTEFETLQTYLGGNATCAGKLKETGLTYWNSPNLGATNETGFNGRGAGQRNYTTGLFSALKSVHFIWSATINAGSYYEYELQANSLEMVSALRSPKYGHSIRPIKDATTLSHGETGTYTDPSGYTYPTICIGTQEWVACNIVTEHYRNGDPIPEVTDNAAWAALATGAICYYNNIESNAFIDGNDIPEVTDNDEWAALATGARCSYDNDEDNV